MEAENTSSIKLLINKSCWTSCWTECPAGIGVRALAGHHVGLGVPLVLVFVLLLDIVLDWVSR